jgi:DNA-cytosine methyltransferase
VRVGSLFSGIGGIDLALERIGHETIWQCEIDGFCRDVLADRFGVPIHGDVRELHADNVGAVDILAGGFPCQPVSLAGRRLAQEDARWLWPEFGRLVGELRPRYVFVENVPGLYSRGLEDVLGTLADLGYSAEWDRISAADVGAPHLRRRFWLLAVADAARERLEVARVAGLLEEAAREGPATVAPRGGYSPADARRVTWPTPTARLGTAVPTTEETSQRRFADHGYTLNEAVRFPKPQSRRERRRRRASDALPDAARHEQRLGRQAI